MAKLLIYAKKKFKESEFPQSYLRQHDSVFDFSIDNSVQEFCHSGQNYFSSAPFFSRGAEVYSSEIRKWMSGIGKVFRQFPKVYLTRLGECNFSKNEWAALYRLAIIHVFFENKVFDSITFHGDDRLGYILKKYCQSKDIHFKGNALGSFQIALTSMKSVARYFVNLLRDLGYAILSFKLYRNRSDLKGSALVYTGFPNNWIGELESRFRYCSASRIPNVDTSYLVSISRHNTPLIYRVKKGKNNIEKILNRKFDAECIILEAYSSLKKICLSYFNFKAIFYFLLCWKRRKKKIKPFFGCNFRAFFNLMFLESCLVDYPKNRMLELMAIEAFKQLKCKVLLSPVFELLEGRGIVGAGNDYGLFTAGIQHGSNGPIHNLRFSLGGNALSKGLNQTNFLPKLVCTEGVVSQEEYKRDSEFNVDVSAVGALRLPSPKYLSYTPDILSIQVLLDMHFSEELLSVVVNMAKKSEYTFFVRPHPARAKSVKAFFSKNPISNIMLSSYKNDILTDIFETKPNFVFAGNTGSVCELALSGIPIVIYQSNWLPGVSPFSYFPDKIFMAGHSTELLSFFKVLEDPQERAVYLKKCQRLSESHVTDLGDGAYLNLSKFIMNHLS